MNFTFKQYVIAIVLLLINGTVTSQNWDQIQKVISSDRDENDRFGFQVEIDEDVLVIGARADGEDENGQNPLTSAGSCYIFERNPNGSWGFVQKIVAPVRKESDQFGVSVGVHGNFIVVGAKFEDEDENEQNPMNSAGSAYIFERGTDGIWTMVQKIVASDREGSDTFGTNVDIYGSVIVVGTVLDDDDENGVNPINDAGSAYIFEKNSAGLWEESSKIVASDRGMMDYFGSDVATNGEFVMVGAHNAGVLSHGTVYAYTKVGGIWTETQIIIGSDSNLDNGNDFGIAADMDDNQLIVGASNKNFDAGGGTVYQNAGAAYIFTNDGSGNWVETGKIAPNDPEDNGLVGFSVSIDDNYAIAGGYRVESDEQGANNFEDAGAAYVFGKQNGTWSLERKLVSNDRAEDDFFAYHVGIANGTAVAGAIWEDEDETGNNFLSRAGSAYLFGIDPNLFLDDDADGVSNAQEIEDNTDPNDPCSLIVSNQTQNTASWDDLDCDGDGLRNAEERDNIDDSATPLIPTGITDPLDPCDPERGADFNGYESSNLIWRNGDCDMDTVLNGTEFDDGTNPYNEDTDGDGVLDGPDGVNALSPCLPVQGAGYTDYDSTNLLWLAENCDTDSLVNDQEVQLSTDPYSADTDGDGFMDDEEVACGSNPLDEDEDCLNLHVTENKPLEIVMFPNPCRETLNITTNTPFKALQILDMAGRVVDQKVLDDRPQEYTVDVSGYANGVYFVKISEENQKQRFFLFLKE